MIWLVWSALALSVYDALAIDQQVPIYYQDELPGGYNAITWPPIGIFIRTDQLGNNALIAHELVHWYQYQQRGSVIFYLQYLGELITYGYDHMPLELQARFLESDAVKYRYTEAVRNGEALTVYNPNFRR